MTPESRRKTIKSAEIVTPLAGRNASHLDATADRKKITSSLRPRLTVSHPDGKLRWLAPSSALAPGVKSRARTTTSTTRIVR